MARRSRRREPVLSREVGAVRKPWGGRIRVALVYPNRYETGMSNLGFLSIHARINAREDALCERAFLPGPGAPRGDRDGSRGETRTLESGRLLAEFDVVAFSLSFENDLLHLPALLQAGGVPPFREDRHPPARKGAGTGAPLVLAGGFAASLNPEPVGTMADAVVVGDGERAIETLLDRGEPRFGDAEYRKELAAIPGLYVPAGYRPEYSPGEDPRLVALHPLPGFPSRVRREEISLEEFPPMPVVLAERTELGRMALLETSRGCPKRCGFCAAAHACPRFREVPPERFRALVDAAWPHRTTIGFVGAAVLDWRPFREIAREILARGGAVSPASVRADLVDGEIAEILRRSGHRTVSLAPECGDEPLRYRIGKRVPDETFRTAARTLARAGIVSFKLYFLTGVPGTEREEETEGILRFLRSFREALLAQGRSIGRMGTVTAVLSPFVPKPFTPMQWAPMAREEELTARHARIAAAVRRIPNLRVRAESPRASLLQGYLGLSDRRAGSALRAAMAGKVRPDAPAFDPPLPFVVHREKPFGEFLPWDVIEGGLPKRTLWTRYRTVTRG
ncbi:MAG: radical SAM protein [Deltaproteobacteria bacterium]